MEVILLVHASYLVFYKANCIPYFNILHLKLKEKKLECEFREVEEEEKKIDVLEMGKRLQLVEDKLEMIALLEKYDIKIKD